MKMMILSRAEEDLLKMHGTQAVISCILLMTVLTTVTANLFEYYQEPPHQHSVTDDERRQDDDDRYTLYLKPVLMEKTAAVEKMYFTLRDKQVVLVPAAFHILPYPLQYVQQQQEQQEKSGSESVRHHVESSPEYEDENYSNTEAEPTSHRPTNTTVYGSKYPENEKSPVTKSTTTKPRQ